MRYFNQEQRDEEENNMNNFYYQGDENDEDEDDDDETYSEFSDEDILGENLFYNKELKIAELDLMEQELKSKVLFKVMDNAKKSFFWWFYSKSTKLKMIEENFVFCMKLIQSSDNLETEVEE